MDENAPGTKFDANSEEKPTVAHWWTAAVNLWMALVLLLFFVLRVFDSHTAQRLWRSLVAR